MIDPFYWGQNGDQQSMDARRMAMANAANLGPIASPMQGMAHMASSYADARNAAQQASGFPQAPATAGNLFGLANIFGMSPRSGGLY